MISLLTVGLCGLGFAQLIAVTPLGKIKRKPFSCRTCLSAWAAMLGAYGGLPPSQFFDGRAQEFAAWVVLWLAGVGVAQLGFAALDMATRAREADTADALADIPPPPPITFVADRQDFSAREVEP